PHPTPLHLPAPRAPLFSLHIPPFCTSPRRSAPQPENLLPPWPRTPSALSWTQAMEGSQGSSEQTERPLEAHLREARAHHPGHPSPTARTPSHFPPPSPPRPRYGWVLLLLERPTQGWSQGAQVSFSGKDQTLFPQLTVCLWAPGTQAEEPSPPLGKPVWAWAPSLPRCLPLQRARAWPRRAHTPEAQALLPGSTPGNPGHMPTCPFKPRGPLASRLAPNSSRAEGPPPGHCDTLPSPGNPVRQPRPPTPSPRTAQPPGNTPWRPGTLRSRSIEAKGRLAAVGHAATGSN
ncbi:hypothetical protein H1C71_031036, partial [Ictidomys tridecemlineatus]